VIIIIVVSGNTLFLTVRIPQWSGTSQYKVENCGLWNRN